MQTQKALGMTFYVYIPRVDDVTLPETPVHSIATCGGGETIMIIEDEAGIREIVKHSLDIPRLQRPRSAACR